MKIGIDAKWFFIGNPSGKVVIQNIVKEIIELRTNHELYIFLRKEDRNKYFPYSAPNVHLIYIWVGNNMLSNLFVFPLIARSLKLDVVFFQTFVPFFAYRNSVVFIYDCIHLTNPEYFSLAERLYYYPIKYLARIAKRIITISESEKQRIVTKMNIDESLVSVAHCGVSEEYVPLANSTNEKIKAVIEKYKLPEKYLLYVGRLNTRKNLLNLVKAVSLLENKDIPILFVGKKDYSTREIEEAIDRYGLKDRVLFLGYVEGADLPHIYALAKVFCYVSFDEGFGMPPLEAMSCGVPVVVANTGSLPEICGNDGCYIDPNSPKDIALKIDHLLSDNNYYNEMKEKSMRNAKRFHWRKSAKIILDVLQKSE